MLSTLHGIANCIKNRTIRKNIPPTDDSVSLQCGPETTFRQGLWKGLLHHVCGKHNWLVAEAGISHYEHGEIEESLKPLLKPRTPAFNQLNKIAWNTRFLKTISYYINFRSTSDLEVFNDHLLMYCSKRHAYQYTGYKARCQLCAIDRTKHKDRPYKLDSSGNHM